MTPSPSTPALPSASSDAVTLFVGPQPEALIEEARRRASRRRARNAAGLLAAALLGIIGYAGLSGGGDTVPAQASSPGTAPTTPVAAGRPVPQPLAFNAGSTIWIAGTDGTIRRLTSDTRSLSALTWTPDGRQLLASLGDGNGTRPGSSLVTVDTNGIVGPELAYRVTSASGLQPGGSTIAFQRGHWRDESGLNVYRVEVDGGAVHVLATNGRDAHGGPTRLAWSPDGRELLYSGVGKAGRGLYVVDAVGSRSPQRISIDPALGAPNNASFSPDGKWIVFEGWKSDSSRSLPAVYVMRRDGTDLRRLARAASIPEWSPEGRRIAFLQHRPFGRIAVVGIDGSDPRPVGGCVCNLRGPGFSPTLNWSRDGAWLAFVGARGNVISISQTDGSTTRPVARVPATLYPGIGGPLWQPRG